MSTNTLRRLGVALLIALGAASTSAIEMPVVAGGDTSGFINLDNHTVTSSVGDPLDAEAAFRLDQDGKIYQRVTNGGAFTEIVSNNWIFPHDDGLADFYESRATLTSGACTSGTFGTWEALTVDRTWSLLQTVVGSSQCVFLLEIRFAGGGVLDSATITLDATVG